jgi:hypothetical protein
MRKKLAILILSLALCAFPAINLMLGGIPPLRESFALSYAQQLSVAEIFKNVKEFDGKTVVFEGEVIGDVMRRGNFAWVNVYNFDDAIGVWMEASLANSINYTGSYKSRGDKIEVVGVFHRACPEHGGDADIHAQALRKISEGKLRLETVSFRKINFIVLLLGVLALIWIFRRSRRS